MGDNGSILCRIPNQETLVKLADAGADYVVRWKSHEGLVKKTNTLPASASQAPASCDVASSLQPSSPSLAGYIAREELAASQQQAEQAHVDEQVDASPTYG